MSARPYPLPSACGRHNSGEQQTSIDDPLSNREMQNAVHARCTPSVQQACIARGTPPHGTTLHAAGAGKYGKDWGAERDVGHGCQNKSTIQYGETHLLGLTVTWLRGVRFVWHLQKLKTLMAFLCPADHLYGLLRSPDHRGLDISIRTLQTGLPDRLPLL